jgi:hypothetical protein
MPIDVERTFTVAVEPPAGCPAATDEDFELLEHAARASTATSIDPTTSLRGLRLS